MTDYLGDFDEDASVPIPFDTADSAGASITATVVVADIEVYRHGSGAIDLTQRTSTTGFTLDVDHDAITGTHMVAIDTSDNTDAGFFATGYDYFVKLNTITVDSQTISKWIGSFSIENRHSSTAIAALNDLAGADILAQVNAALDTAISELSVATPSATPTLRTGLMLLYMALRNKTVVQTSGADALEIHNDAGVKIASKALTDDGSDYTESEMS